MRERERVVMEGPAMNTQTKEFLFCFIKLPKLKMLLFCADASYL